MRGNAYYAMEQVGLCGSLGVWGGLHLLCQVARAVQGVSGGPLEKGLLPIKKDQLQGQVRAGALHKGLKRNSFSNFQFRRFAATCWFCSDTTITHKKKQTFSTSNIS